MGRIIGLIDLDYFYAQCEQLRKPEIKGKPVVVVMPSIREGSGAIATCNYEARALKIKSGMPLSLAKKLANPETIFINVDKEYYLELSQKVFEIVDFFDRNTQEGLKRKIERIKIKLEDAGAGGGSEVLKEYQDISEREKFLSKEMEDLSVSIE
ncbi:MAG: DNA polymerase IV, partial [archaeon]